MPAASRYLCLGTMLAILLPAASALALPTGPADPDATSDGSFEVLASYSGVFMPALTLADEEAEIQSVDLGEPGLVHGIDLGFGVIFPYVAITGSVAFQLGGEATTNDVELSSEYSGDAFAAGAEPDVDLFGIRARFLPYGRIPLGYVAILGGVGLGIDYWDATAKDSTAVADETSNGMFNLPLALRFDVKPTCGFVLVAQGGYTIGLTGPAIQYPFFSLGLGYQSCAGEDDSSSYEPLPAPAPYVAPEPYVAAPAPAPEPQAPFQSEQVAGLGDPEIVLVNNTDVEVTVQVNGPMSDTIVLPAHETQRRQMPAGTYSFTASAPGLGGTSGINTFDADNRYTWLFEVRSTTQP